MSSSKSRWMTFHKALPRWDFDGFYLVLIMFNNNTKCWLPTLSVNCTFIFLRLAYSLHVWIASSQPLNIWSMKLCVWYVYTCKYMHVCVGACARKWRPEVNTGSHPHCSSPYFLRQDLSWTLELTDSARLTVELQWPSCLQHWGYKGAPSHPALNMGAGDPNTAPYACVAGILLMEPSS